MKPIKLESNLYLVEWKYKDFLRIGYEFQGETIIKLEKEERFNKDYIKVATSNFKNNL
jgi:hypothetical protein